MPFNATDGTKAPWTNGCMTLTNDEVIKVQDGCEVVKEEFKPDEYNPVINDFWIISRYNESNNYTEAINGDTYDVVKSYDREYNTQGIDVSPEGYGYIVPEPQPEEPIEEPTEEQPEEAPVEEETQPEAETTLEEENAPEEAPEAPEAE